MNVTASVLIVALLFATPEAIEASPRVLAEFRAWPAHDFGGSKTQFEHHQGLASSGMIGVCSTLLTDGGSAPPEGRHRRASMTARYAATTGASMASITTMTGCAASARTKLSTVFARRISPDAA